VVFCVDGRRSGRRAVFFSWRPLAEASPCVISFPGPMNAGITASSCATSQLPRRDSDVNCSRFFETTTLKTSHPIWSSKYATRPIRCLSHFFARSRPTVFYCSLIALSNLYLSFNWCLTIPSQQCARILPFSLSFRRGPSYPNLLRTYRRPLTCPVVGFFAFASPPGQ